MCGLLALAFCSDYNAREKKTYDGGEVFVDSTCKELENNSLDHVNGIFQEHGEFIYKTIAFHMPNCRISFISPAALRERLIWRVRKYISAR